MLCLSSKIRRSGVAARNTSAKALIKSAFLRLPFLWWMSRGRFGAPVPRVRSANPVASATIPVLQRLVAVLS